MESLRNIVEKSVFGVCTAIARYIGIHTSRVRLYFIYTSFVTMGSPVIIYLIMAFWINIKKYIRNNSRFVID